jgi:hypothetical protein
MTVGIEIMISGRLATVALPMTTNISMLEGIYPKLSRI